MPEAARGVVEWGFKKGGLAKICARANPHNKRSWRVMEKVGMTREGRLRSQALEPAERVDYLYYGILRAEWEQGRFSSRE